jgi:hypothetical protein
MMWIDALAETIAPLLAYSIVTRPMIDAVCPMERNVAGSIPSAPSMPGNASSIAIVM